MRTRLSPTIVSLTSAVFCTVIAGAARGKETVSGVAVSKTKVVNRPFSNDWDVKVTFDIIRPGPNPPANIIYFSVFLVEVDIVFDEKFGPVLVCVPVDHWTKRLDGQFQASLNVLFKKISDYYGDDWTVKGACVQAVPCPQNATRVGGGVGQVTGGYQYDYVCENDPDSVGMDIGAQIVQLVVGVHVFDFAPPIARGQLGSVSMIVPEGPLPDGDDVTGPSTVPYSVKFLDGTILSGQTVGPSNPVPALSLGGLTVLLLSVTAAGAAVFRVRSTIRQKHRLAILGIGSVCR